MVTIASYPKRAHLLPAVYEALNNQTTVPQKWLLVLSEEEWPRLNLPNYLNKLRSRWLKIVWVKNNIKRYTIQYLNYLTNIFANDYSNKGQNYFKEAIDIENQKALFANMVTLGNNQIKK